MRIVGAKGVTITAYCYWTGRGVRTDPLKGNAYRFETANAARQCANTHEGLRDSEDWYVVPIGGKSLANKENA